MEYDENGRLMVHGLLTASIGTKVGEELHYIARELVSEFIRPVFTGSTCELQPTKCSKWKAIKSFNRVSLSQSA